MKWTGCHKKMKNQPVSFSCSLKLTYYVSSFLFWMMMDSIIKLEMRGVLKMMYLWTHLEIVVEKHQMAHCPDCGNSVECRH